MCLCFVLAGLLGSETIVCFCCVVVTEVVFNYPGLGRLVIESISDRDLPVVQALALILALIYVGVNLIADLLTLVVNPRLRTLQIRK